MTYKIKQPKEKEEIKFKAYKLQIYHDLLEEEAHKEYGSEYNNLTEKEKNEIAFKIAKKLK